MSVKLRTSVTGKNEVKKVFGKVSVCMHVHISRLTSGNINLPPKMVYLDIGLEGLNIIMDME